MKKEALLKLADILENEVKDENFSLGEWKCGTTACAIGHAFSNRWFKDRRFRSYCVIHYPSGDLPDIIAPAYKDFRDWEAVEKFFQLDWSESRYLFDEDEYEDKRRSNVVKRIRKFVECDGMPDWWNDK